MYDYAKDDTILNTRAVSLKTVYVIHYYVIQVLLFSQMTLVDVVIKNNGSIKISFNPGND